jgi:ABC-type taurine transport system ATPase subunit
LIAHSIDEALWLGECLIVFERPARIAYEAKLGPDRSEAERQAVRGRVREVLSGGAAAT